MKKSWSVFLPVAFLLFLFTFPSAPLAAEGPMILKYADIGPATTDRGKIRSMVSGRGGKAHERPN